MKRPIYEDERFPQNFREEFHAGLWYNKFCNTWTHDWRLEAPEKLQWIESLALSSPGKGKKTPSSSRGSPRKIGSQHLITNAINRLNKLIQAVQGECLYFKTDSRFVTGLGLDHPVENGFLWHATLGVPYIPGSTVKGLVRSWVEEWNPEENLIGKKGIARIFGSEDKQSGPQRVGSVIFFDALPVEPVTLEADVMTPHYEPYYSKGEPPGDWHSPIPIPFLTVASGQVFLFALAARNEAGAKDRELVGQWLKEALQWVGVGAKTAVGYGRFVEQQRKEPVRGEVILPPVVKDPVLKEMIEDGYYASPDNGRFLKTFDEKWRLILESDAISLEEKQHIAGLLKQWYRDINPKQWHKPNKKNREKLRIINAYL